MTIRIFLQKNNKQLNNLIPKGIKLFQFGINQS